MFEAYKVAVRLSLVSNVAAGLSAMAGQFSKLNQHSNAYTKNLTAIERKMADIKRLGMVGGIVAGAGAMGLASLMGPLEEARKYQLEIAKFRSLGVGDAVTNDAIKFSKGLNTYGTSITENISLLRDAQTIFGDYGHAKFVTPLLAKMKFANEAMYGEESGGMNERRFMDMLKVIELRKGLSSEGAFSKQANMIQQVLTATGGRVGANEYLNFIKTGGVAAKSMKDDVFYYKMEPLIQEMGGNRIGTGLMSAYTNLILGRTTVQTAKELQRLNLLDPKHIEYNKIGMIKRILPGGLRGGDDMMSDPVSFLENTLLPAFRAKGITSEQDTLREMGMVFSNRTASNLFSTMYLQLANIHKNEKLNRGAKNIDQLDEEAQKQLGGKEIRLRKQWSNLLNELGTSILPIAIKAVSGLIVVVKGLVNFAQRFPVLTRNIMISFAVLSTIVAAGGVLMMATAAFRALGLALAFNSAGGSIGILQVARNVGMLTKGLGAFGLMVFGVSDAINAITTGKSVSNDVVSWIGRKIGLFGKDDTLGTWGYNAMHGDYDTVKPGNKNGGGGKGDIYMDGRKVGEIVTGHQTKSLSKPFGGQSVFDMSMSPMPIGMKVQK